MLKMLKRPALALAVILAAAMASPVQPAVEDDAAAVWRLQTPTEAHSHFGAVECYHWIGTLGDKANAVPFDLHMLDARLSDYDLAQRRQWGESWLRKFSGALVVEDRTIQLLGEVIDGVVRLYDLELLVGGAMDEESWQALVDRLVKDNERRLPQAAQTVKLIAPELEFTVFLAKPLIDDPTPDDSAMRLEHTTVAAAGRTSARRTCWIGEFRDTEKRLSDYRLEVVEIMRAGAEHEPAVAHIAISTMRLRHRRLEGPVPTDSPWPSRMVFAHALRDIGSADIDWPEGEFTDEAVQIVKRHIGIERTKSEFFADIDRVFGSRDAAIDACCPFPEVVHSPLASRPIGKTPMLIGTDWYVETDETYPMHILLAHGVNISARPSRYPVHLFLTSLPPLRPEGHYDYLVRGRRLPVESAANPSDAPPTN